MKNLQLLFIALCVGIFSCTSDQKKEWKEYTDKEKLSYSIGMEYAIALQQEGMDSIIDLDFFHRAFEETFLFTSGTPGSLDSASLDTIRKECQKVVVEYFEMRQKNMVEKQLSENRKLIKESNGEEIVLASGLKIIIIEDKDGLSPQLSDTVTTELLITALDGIKPISKKLKKNKIKFINPLIVKN